MLTVDSHRTTNCSSSLASLAPRAAAWVLVATLAFSVTACDTTSETTGPSPETPTTQGEATEIKTGRAEIEGEPVMKTVENPDPQEPERLSPPSEVDPGDYGFDSLDEMKAAIKEAMDLPPEMNIRLVEQQRGEKEGLTVIGAGYNNER